MKVIDIYNKIANGEELPKKIKYAGDIYEYEEKQLDYRITYSSRNMYLLAHHNNFVLNETIEIIEEPILTDKEYEDIEEIKIDYDDGDIALDGVYLTSNHSEILANKINTLIRNQKYILEEIKKLKED